MAVIGIHHTGLVVPDRERALAFYSGVLGFQAVNDSRIESIPDIEAISRLQDPAGSVILLQSSWGYLELWHFERPHCPEHQFFWTPVNKYGIRHISLIVDDAMGVYHNLRDRMLYHREPIMHSVEGPENEAWSAYARDPFGNVLELWQLGEQDPQPFAPDPAIFPEAANRPRVGRNGVLGLHHTAIVVPDLEAAADFYGGVLGFERAQVGPIEPVPYAEEITQLEQPEALAYLYRTGWGYLEVWEYRHPVYPATANRERPFHKCGFNHLSLLVDDCEAECRRLAEHMDFYLKPGEGPQNIAWGHDPYGNLVQLRQLTSADPQPYPPESALPV